MHTADRNGKEHEAGSRNRKGHEAETGAWSAEPEQANRSSNGKIPARRPMPVEHRLTKGGHSGAHRRTATETEEGERKQEARAQDQE